MTVRADAWMPLYVADYMRDTPHLSVEQHGAYFLLIMACWTRGGSLPNDDRQLAQIAKMSAHNWKRHGEIIRQFFRAEGPALTHKRVTEEFQKAQRLSEVRREAGARGGRPRAETEKPIGLANAPQTETPSPSPSPLQPPTEIEDNPVSSETVVLFPQAEPSILPCQQATDAWNEMATRSGLSPIRSLNDARRKQLKARLTEHGLDGWGEMLRRLEPSGFLNGNGSTGWRADFDFVIKSTNFLKIIEGKYDDRQPGPSAKFAAKDANLARALAGARTAAARRDQFG